MDKGNSKHGFTSTEAVNQTDRLAALEQNIDHHFRRPALLLEALTHSSFSHEQEHQPPYNERLEFLGDALLGAVTAEALFAETPALPEGDMSRIRAASVCEGTLAKVAMEIGLGHCLYLGRGEEKSGGREKSSNLADALEALFAACYLDSDFDTARAVILRLLNPYLSLAKKGGLSRDYKTHLIEYTQSLQGEHHLQFEVIDTAGPVHQRLFTVRANLSGGGTLLSAVGKGTTKKKAEQEAAKALFFML